MSEVEKETEKVWVVLRFNHNAWPPAVEVLAAFDGLKRAFECIESQPKQERYTYSVQGCVLQ